ncbi:MAG TPA: hypothetical protein VNG04_05375 [Candidatus Acidoferrum sp.]|nr:hypothetical protein [Candidatus Acidoferrum sp.]
MSEALPLDQEDCRFCGKPSSEGHPAGVVVGEWLCYGCDRWQDEPSGEIVDLPSTNTQLEES